MLRGVACDTVTARFTNDQDVSYLEDEVSARKEGR